MKARDWGIASVPGFCYSSVCDSIHGAAMPAKRNKVREWLFGKILRCCPTRISARGGDRGIPEYTLRGKPVQRLESTKKEPCRCRVLS